MRKMDKKRGVLLISHGTLDKPRLGKAEIESLRRFKGYKIAITGWNFWRGPGERMAKLCDMDAVITEGCILYAKPKEGWEKGDPERVVLYDENDLKLVKHANYILLNTIYEYLGESPVLYSQGNEAGICYYVNPPDDIIENLKSLVAPEVSIEKIEEALKEKKIDYKRVSGYHLKLPDNEENRYLVEKIMGLNRTFHPYSLSFEEEKGEEHFLLDLKPEKPKKRLSYEELQKIVEIAWDSGEISYQEFLRMQPQKDVCIDIFCNTKDRTWRRAMEKLGLFEDRLPIYYVSKGTESDIRLIIDGYIKGNFYAYTTTTDITDRLKRIGVKVRGDTIPEVLAFIEKEMGI